MENITLSLYKSLLNFEKISALEFMRKNPEFLDIPGYEISNILNDGAKNGYIERFEDNNKTYYSATNECRKYIKQIEEDKKEAERFEAKQLQQQKNKRKKKVTLIISAICLFLTLIFIFITVVVPVLKKSAFVNKYGQAAYDKFGVVAKGDYIELGSYELDGNTSNGKENIDWLVLDVKDGKMLLISKYILNDREYHPEYPVDSWRSSSLYNWLNNEFFNTVFLEQEKQVITESLEGKLFLLSTDEANTYFDSYDARECTEYNSTYGCSWWLRSLSSENWCADIVSDYGSIDDGANIVWEDHGIRPAMWIDLSKID